MLLLLSTSLTAQTLTFKTNIASSLQETSGLLFLNGKLITHTDSGGEPALYEMDTTSGNQTRKVVVQNATNLDWEDITMDKNFIYIGDFGNNQGNRTNLRIYKISIQDYLAKDTIVADSILFNYADQVNFTPTTFSTNYDAEALISFGDSLYIFTKNWGNLKTNIYPVSKNAGQYSLNKTDSINSQGYITGAICDGAQKQILLIGYTFNSSFFIKINNWNGNQFSTGQTFRKIIQPTTSIQIEGVAQIDSFNYFISSEKFQTSVSELHVLDWRFPTSTKNLTLLANISVSPNPSSGVFNITGAEKPKVSVYNIYGQLMFRTTNSTLDIHHLPKGHYTLEMEIKDKLYYQKIILQ